MPRRLKAPFGGMRSVVRGVVLSVSAKLVEKIAARNVDKSSSGRAVCSVSAGGTSGRETK